MIIKWGELKDNHLSGITPLGKVFIRLGRSGKVSGMYTMFDDIEKFVPQNEEEECLTTAKKVLSDIVKNKIEQSILLKKEIKFYKDETI